MNTPSTSSPAARANTWRQRCAAVSPAACRCAMAKGIDMPTMNRKAGNTTSGKVMASASAAAYSIQAGMPRTPASVFTKIMTRMVMPRKASIASIRAGLEFATQSQVVLAAVRIRGDRLVLVLAVVAQHGVVDVQRIEGDRQVLVDLVVDRRRQVAGSRHHLREAVVQAAGEAGAIGIGQAGAQPVVLVVGLGVVGVFGIADYRLAVGRAAVGVGVVGQQ